MPLSSSMPEVGDYSSGMAVGVAILLGCDVGGGVADGFVAVGGDGGSQFLGKKQGVAPGGTLILDEVLLSYR
ncbi:MAG: hypothetical protein HN919_17085 [Verrucomicrobia bacterium]|nr:hypothetical protein [Verrucomicrobiota bacterium]